MTTTETAPVDTTTTVADVCAGLRVWAAYYSSGTETIGRTPDKDIARHLGITFKRRSADYETSRYDRPDDRFLPGDGVDPAATVDLANLAKAARSVKGHGAKADKLFTDALKKMGINPPAKYRDDVYELAWKTEVTAADLYTWGWDGQEDTLATVYFGWRTANKNTKVARVKDDPKRAADAAPTRTAASFEQAVTDTIAEYKAEIEAKRAAVAAGAAVRPEGAIRVNANTVIPAGSFVSASEAFTEDGVRRWTALGLTS